MTTTSGAIFGVAGLLTALALAAGCGRGPATGEVSGTVTVDGNVPAPGSSITFLPADGKSPTAGALIHQGKYATQVPVGTAKVQVRVPRVVGKAKTKEGPGAGRDKLEEALPAKYNDNTELTFDVKSGRNTKNWDLKAR
jgi:hypothetical protein